MLSLPSDVYGIYLTFCVTTSRDLVTLTFDLLTLKVFHIQCLSCPTHIPILIMHDYRLLSYELSGIVTVHAPCHVTYRRAKKMVHIFEIPNPNVPIHFVTFRALRRRLSHVIGETMINAKHVDIVAMCCKSNSTFLIFADLVV